MHITPSPKAGSPLPLLDIEEAWEKSATRRGFDRMFLQLAQCERAELALRVAAERDGVARRAVTTTVNLVHQELARRGTPVRGRPFFTTGTGRAAHTRLGLDADDPPTDVLFQQARLWTFLPYRRGFQEVVTRTGGREHTVHAYLRVLLTWSRAWLPLTSATAHETECAHRAFRDANGILGPDARRRLSVGLPHVAAADLEELLRPHLPPARSCRAVADTLLDGVRDAVVHQRRDPTMPIVTAYDVVRPLVNECLGGAAARVRVTTGDLAVLDAELSGLLTGGWSRLDAAERAAFLERRPMLRGLLLRAEAAG